MGVTGLIKEEFYIPFTRIRTGKYLFLLVSILLLFVIHPFMDYIGDVLK